MTDLHITTTAGTSMVLDEATMQSFKTSLRGPLLCPGDEGYDAARHVCRTHAGLGQRSVLVAREGLYSEDYRLDGTVKVTDHSDAVVGFYCPRCRRTWAIPAIQRPETGFCAECDHGGHLPASWTQTGGN